MASSGLMRPRRFRRGFVLIGGLLLLLVLWLLFGQQKPAQTKVKPKIPVSVAKATVRDVPVSISEIGSALSLQGVTIRAQVNGVLTRVAFTEGSEVKAGALLAEIDSSPYRAVLLQTEGALQRDKALLEEAQLELRRYKVLLAQDSIAQQQVDAQAAQVKQYQGTVLLDQGAVDAAKVNVNYCKILSPVTGRVGVRLVDPGNIVSTADTNGIVTVDQISPIAVIFTVPEGDFQRLSDVSQSFTLPLQVHAAGQEAGEDLGDGTLTITDNHVDQTTGTVQLKARFANVPRRLWPNQFVNIRLTLQTLRHATVVPSSAVNQGPHGTFAWIVGPGDKVSVRPVTVLATQDAIAVIKSGISPGETVVTDGQLLLKAGSIVAMQSTQTKRSGA